MEHFKIEINYFMTIQAFCIKKIVRYDFFTYIKGTAHINILKNILNITSILFYVLCPKAMLKKPVVTEVRTPTNTWSGLGFSKSMPAETIKELRRANHVSYKPTMTTTFEVCRVIPTPFPVCSQQGRAVVVPSLPFSIK